MSSEKKIEDKIIAFLNEKVPQMGACPLCKQNRWSVSDTIWEVQEFFQGGLKVGSPKMPFVSITCANCGNTIFLNAIVAGIVKPDKKGGKDG